MKLKLFNRSAKYEKRKLGSSSKSKYPHKLPTFWGMLRTMFFYVLAYSIFFIGTRNTVLVVDPEWKVVLGQLGVATVYVAGLIAGLSFYWSSKARENASTASFRIADAVDKRALLDELRRDRGTDHRVDMNFLAEKMMNDEEILKDADRFPVTLEKLGFVSIIVLAIGTLLQLFSLG